MWSRYDVNDYRTFKRILHDAITGSDGTPVPHARTWFPEENEDSTSNSRRGRNSNDDDDEDDDIIIEGATTNIKCPLTLQVFKEPYSNDICNHTFEKEAILNYLAENGTVFAPSSQRPRGPRGAPLGPKQVKCPQVGCEAVSYTPICADI